MGVISTRRSRLKGDGTVMPAFRSANITQVTNLKEMVHAATKGTRQRFAGVEDWNGTWNEFGMVPSFYPGDEVTWYGSLQGTAGWTGDAIVTQVVMTYPVGTKDPPTIEGTFRGVTDLDKTDTTAVALPAAPADISTPEGLCVQLASLSASPSYANQSGTNEITLTLSIEDQEFHHCGSSGIMDALEGLWDVELSYKRYIDTLTDLPTEGVAYHVRIPIDSAGAQYWQIEYLKVGDITDILFDREGGGLLNVTIPMSMSIIESIGGTATVGSGVTKPGGGVWRPDEA